MKEKEDTELTLGNENVALTEILVVGEVVAEVEGEAEVGVEVGVEIDIDQEVGAEVGAGADAEAGPGALKKIPLIMVEPTAMTRKV